MRCARVIGWMCAGLVAGAAGRAWADEGLPALGVSISLDGSAAPAPVGYPCGATWTSARLPPATTEARDHADLTEAEERYAEADNLGCLERIGRVGGDNLLARGLRAAAGRREVLEVACALGAGDEARARVATRRLLARELWTSEALAGTTPAVQELIEEGRIELGAAGLTELPIDVVPAVSHVFVDGVERCDAAPCRVSLRPGAHVIRVGALGFAAQTVSHVVPDAGPLAVELAVAPAQELRQQLADAIDAGAASDTVEVLELLARAFDARYVATSRRAEGGGRAILFDARTGRVLARAEAEEAATASATVLAQGCPEPDPGEPVEVWVGVVLGAAALVGLAVGLSVWGEQETRARLWEIRF